MKKYFFLLALSLLAGCATITSYKADPNAKPGEPKPDDYPIPVYTEDMDVPRPCEEIGQVTIGSTGATVSGGSIEDEMKKVMKTAHEKGADVVHIISVTKPGYTSANYGVVAALMRYSDPWEKTSISENDFARYLQKNAATLDPIEGVWSGGWPNRIGIMRDTSKPGRDFIAFTINSDSPVWKAGYKKIDIARGTRPGTYNLIYYRNDFAISETTLALSQNWMFSFTLQTKDDSYQVTYKKIGNPIIK